MKVIIPLLALAFGFLISPSPAEAEFRSAKDMQQECRVALSVFQGKAENTSANALLAGECVGYVQGAADASLALTENVSWYKVCTPKNASTLDLIQKFILFVEANPKYTLASTAIEMMLAKEFP